MAGIEERQDFWIFKCLTISSAAFNPGKSIIIFPFGPRAYWTSLVQEKPPALVIKSTPQILFIKEVFPAPTDPKRIILFQNFLD